MSLPRGAMSWFVVCDGGIYKSYTLVFFSHLAGKETAGYFTLIVFQLSCEGLCSVSLPRGAVSWSLIVTFTGHTHLLFAVNLLGKRQLFILLCVQTVV